MRSCHGKDIVAISKNVYVDFKLHQRLTFFLNYILSCHDDSYFGQRNLIYLTMVGALWYITGSYEMFFALTSFVHYCRWPIAHCSLYFTHTTLLPNLLHFLLPDFLILNFASCRYISTFYIRRGIDFGSFKRDVLLFKSIALSQLFYCYVMPTKSPFQVDPVSIGMIISG